MGGGVLEDDAASSVTPPSIAAGEAGPAPDLPEGMTEHRDQAAGFAIGYPADWQVLESTDPQVSLVASRNQKDSLLVRAVRLNGPVGPAEFPQFKSLTEEVVRGNQGVEVLEGPREVEVGGLPGYFYLYRFTDGTTGERGAHSHYFLFRDATMITLVSRRCPRRPSPSWPSSSTGSPRRSARSDLDRPAALGHPVGAGLLGVGRAGDWVTIHWGWVCEVVDARGLADLQRWSAHHLAIANQTI